MTIIVGKDKVNGGVAAYGTHTDAVQVSVGSQKTTLTALLELMADQIANMEGPKYDASRECVVFPAGSKVRYDASREGVVFG